MRRQLTPRSFLPLMAVSAMTLAVSLLGCAGPGTEAGPPDTDIAPSEQAGAAEPWTVEEVQVDTTDGVRVLVLHDMEGLSGQDDWHSFDYGQPEYAHGQELLAADINAVVDGLFAGGATEVHVVDGHGSGNPEPDLRADLLDPRARQVLRNQPFDTYFDVPETTSGYNAVAVVGMHAKTGSGGFASHTFTLGIEFQIHGQPITETELVGLSWGRYGVPVIFASGDDRLAADLRTMPWIEFVTVKTATSASTADPRPVDEARAELREAARRAVEDLGSAKVMKVRLPVRATLRAVPPASLRVLEGVPGIDYADETVSFVVDDLRAAYDGLEALVGAATTAYVGVLREQLGEMGLAERVGSAYNEALTDRWLDYESGRWAPPAAAETREVRVYHGYR